MSADATQEGPFDIGCDLEFTVVEPSVVAFQIAPARTGGVEVRDDLVVEQGDGVAVPVRELVDDLGSRLHVVSAEPGRLHVHYEGAARRGAGAAPAEHAAVGDDVDAIVGLRQSRYCPSDALTGFAVAEFGDPGDAPAGEVAARVAGWVHERTSYQSGSSGPLDTALDTLHAATGVCRDFAHLTTALCRALGIPARLVAVYAPGLSPMDFHAVVEVRGDSGWEVVDPSRLAPRHSLVRIATGRDAADTAFASTLRGDLQLESSVVRATVAGDLPLDDHRGVVRLP